MSSKNKSKGYQIPADIAALLDEEDRFHGRPVGTMQSVLRQETGGQLQKFLENPEEYHYGLNEQGQRIAGHTGKVSTAFGPFGILESTAAKPGYGVAPLQDKGIAEQIRFASDYLQARIKQGGSLEKGLAGYGEGAKYAQQVMNRLNGKSSNGSNGTGFRNATYASRGDVNAKGSTNVGLGNEAPVAPVNPPAGNKVAEWANFLDALKSNMTTPREHDPMGGPNMVGNQGQMNPMAMMDMLMGGGSESGNTSTGFTGFSGFDTLRNWGVI